MCVCLGAQSSVSATFQSTFLRKYTINQPAYIYKIVASDQFLSLIRTLICHAKTLSFVNLINQFYQKLSNYLNAGLYEPKNFTAPADRKFKPMICNFQIE